LASLVVVDNKNKIMSEQKYKYKSGDRVYFDMGVGNIDGWAKIAGCSTEPMPELGRGWIVELEEPRKVDVKVYPFSHIVIFDVMIKEPPVGK
jgi:hypothetical protein